MLPSRKESLPKEEEREQMSDSNPNSRRDISDRLKKPFKSAYRYGRSYLRSVIEARERERQERPEISAPSGFEHVSGQRVDNRGTVQDRPYLPPLDFESSQEIDNRKQDTVVDNTHYREKSIFVENVESPPDFLNVESITDIEFKHIEGYYDTEKVNERAEKMVKEIVEEVKTNKEKNQESS